MRGIVIGGSTGRGDPWPMSDIDLVPISSGDTRAEVDRRQAAMVDWWAASGRAQTLDVGWVCFSDIEAEAAIESGPQFAADRMSDPRWLHGIDKSFEGRGAGDLDGIAQRFADWVAAVRFDPVVVAGRIDAWRDQVEASRVTAVSALAQGNRAAATLALRESARALRLVLLEGWGERLGSMGREWTRFERIARARDEDELAQRIAAVADAGAAGASRRAESAPVWLRERVDLAYRARREVREKVSMDESARDQMVAFAVLIRRRTSPPFDAWLGLSDADTEPERKLGELEELIDRVCV